MVYMPVARRHCAKMMTPLISANPCVGANVTAICEMCTCISAGLFVKIYTEGSEGTEETASVVVSQYFVPP